MLGKASVKTVVVRSGLKAGDKVILSDLSELDGAPKVQID